MNTNEDNDDALIVVFYDCIHMSSNINIRTFHNVICTITWLVSTYVGNNYGVYKIVDYLAWHSTPYI